MTNDITNKLRTECMTILNCGEIVGQVVINEIDESHYAISQSNFLPDNRYDLSYEKTKLMIEKYAKHKYGEDVTIRYSDLNAVEDNENQFTNLKKKIDRELEEQF